MLTDPSKSRSADRHSPLIQNRAAAAGWLLILGIILVATTMRAPLTSAGPLLADIAGELGISNTAAGMITTLPLLAFALMSPFAPKLAKRYGIPAVLFGAMILLTAGVLLRSSGGAAALFIGTGMLGLAISVCNVLLPSLIKQRFPSRIGVMTGVYSASMNLCAAVASGISVPLAVRAGLGWKSSLGIWAILSAVALVLWLPQLKGSRPPQAAVHRADARRTSLWRSALAWQVTLFMGFQSVIFYSLITWLPAVLIEQGLSSDTAGYMLSVMQLVSLPFAFIVPIWAGRMQSQRLLAIIGAAAFLIGILGLSLELSQWAVLWAVSLGIGGGFSFSVAMMLFSQRTRSSLEAAELSGMAQSVGYLLAACGPLLVGYLHDLTHHWLTPLLLLGTASVILMLAGYLAGRSRYVS
ncbi:MFS transporter [Paenibacillus sp. JX-17]|uniref:MFS transporter n=1 Tax=Paenibacillus lacisoli TaxID=3064525 RepID=A0ABT9CCH4_9BACL|nr:MFS transporter [Paenibacillus sp. JX-17]MDO7906960.1 MFS transporter [Paenibacillus sp. JX-17]